MSKNPNIVEPTPGVWDIAHERHRQIVAKGFDENHDLQHGRGELLFSAKLLIEGLICDGDPPVAPSCDIEHIRTKYDGQPFRILQIAGALIAAEIERRQKLYWMDMPYYGETEHPKGYEGECGCDTCMSYA